MVLSPMAAGRPLSPTRPSASRYRAATATPSAFLLGRRTFDIFRGYWPDQTDPANPIASAINSLPKYVVSNSISEADARWRGEHPGTARLVAGDVVAGVQALKEEPGDELQIWGSGDLLQTLLRHGSSTASA